MLHLTGADVTLSGHTSQICSGIARFGLLAFATLTMASCLRFDPPPIHAVLVDQSQLYPRMQVQDWYKLLHQSAMGSAHLGADSSAIYNYLLHEWESLGPARNERMIEYISPDSQMVRLNLRPYKESGGTPAAVYAMMAVSWKAFTPSVDRLEGYLAQLVFMAEHGDVWLNPDVLAAFLEEQRARDYPAVHHSEIYEQVYHPAYRVVLRSTLPR
ncbi:MAG: hypothetical protein R2834_06345 [Rhodothermales bacterium]